MKLTGPFRKQLRLAIQDAYPAHSALRVMVKESLDEELQNITLAADMPTVVFDLIAWFVARGRITELVQAAAAENPGNPLLRAASSSFAFARDETGEVERVVLEKVGFENVAQWIARLEVIRRCICRIEPQPESIAGYGTGFLVSPDVVLTNFHVRGGFQDPAQVAFRFDYEGEGAKGAVHSLAAADWELVSSPLSELDYALLRLSRPAAEDAVPGASAAAAADAGARQRGYLRPQAKDFGDGEPVLIMQHPNAEPLKISIGSVKQADSSLDRVAYTANTKGGSSGSPCLTMALEVSALHHWGGEFHNRGVRIAAILGDLEKQGQRKLLGA